MGKNFSIVDGLSENLSSLENTVLGRMLITTDKCKLYYEPQKVLK